MNRLCYRVIFSKTLNKLIVVSEKTSAQAKSGSRPSPNIHIQKNQSAFLSLSSIKPTPLYLAILLGFVSHTTYANIIADPTAPNTHKPIIVAGTNTQGQKVPVVQIRTPVNGISHNKYSQFDVAQVGVVLNNSRTGTPTHLAGTIGANPFLQQGEAHTLINEVNSSKISQLSGNIEIAGQKANLIIANPNGINVQGLGFINVHNATLSTGLLRHGTMGHQHHVNQGKITVNADVHGRGFSEHQKADYVNLYARAIEVNAKIHANDQITIVTGSNQVDSLGQVSQMQANGAKPQISLDVKSLGGMYADSIYLVGTEKGLGVHHSGVLQANHALIVTQEGRIENTGKLQVTDGGMVLSSKQDLMHQGNTTAKGHIQFNAQNTQLKQGAIQSQHGDIDVQAKQIDLQNVQLHALQGSTNLLATEHNITTTQATVTANEDVRMIALQGNVNHHNSKLKSATGNVVSSAYNKQNIHNSSISAANTTLIESKNQDLAITNSTATSGKSAIVYSGGNQATTNSSFIANQGVLSNVSIGKHTITGEVQYTGSGVVLNHQSIDVQDDSRLTARAAANTALSKHETLKNINGRLSVETKEALALDVDKHQLHASHDISVHSKEGELTLQAKNKQNQPVVYALSASQGDILLAGTSVELQGSQLNAKGDVSLYATNGDVYIYDVSATLDQRQPKKNLQKFNDELKVANQALELLRQSQEYQTYQQTLNQLVTEKNALISPRDEPENTIGSSDNAIEHPPNDPLRAHAFSSVAFRSVHMGRTARSVRDPASLMEVMAGQDNLKPEKRLAAINKKIEDLKKQYATIIAKENQLSGDIGHLQRRIGFLAHLVSGKEYLPSQVVSEQGNVNVYAKQGIVASGSHLTAKQGDITLEAQGVSQQLYQHATKIGNTNNSSVSTSILLSGTQDVYEIGQDGQDHHRILSLTNPSTLVAGKNIRVTATSVDPNSHLVLQGAKMTAKDDIDIKSNHNLLLDTAIDYEYSYHKDTRKHGKWYNRKTTTTQTTNEYSDANVTELTANNITLQTQGGPANTLNIYAAKMATTGGNVQLLSSGDINLYAVHNQHNTQHNSHTKKKIAGIRYAKKNSRYQKNQITALPASLAANYIHSTSKNNTTLEGTQFSYLSGATIKAGEKLTLLAATSALYEQSNKDDNYVVWQSTINQGKHQETAILPSFTGSSRPNFIADGGIEVQIPISEKDVQKRTLKEQILKLSARPEYSYLSELATRNDIDWQEIILTDKEWNYKQQGLTEAGAALVAIAVAAATGGAGSHISAFVAGSATNAGIAAGTAGTLGAMSSAAFGSLVSTASISLINNQGDIKATLKELGSKQNVKQLTFAIASAGISSNINQTLSKSFGVDDIANSHNFSHKISKGIANATSTALLESAIYGTSLEKSLIKNLRGEVANAVASEIFTDRVKPLDKDTLIDNITHKLAAGMTGCLSAKAAGNSCEAGTIGAIIGEMWGDYQVDDPNTLSQEQKDKLINQAKLLAGIAAAFAGEDVNVAASVAGEAVRWNAIYINKGSIPKNQQAECEQLGISSSDCGRYHGEKKLKILKEIGLFIVPTTKEELALAIVTGGAGRYVIKAGGKVISKVFKSKDEAQKALDKAQELAKSDTKAKAEVEPATNSKANTTNSSKSVACTTNNSCFTAGTLIHTTDGLKPIETITHGDLIWSRQEFGTEYGYRPVIATKVTPNQEIYEVVVKHSNNTTETFKTTKEHPFWVEGIGWLKASLLEQGMTLLDKHGLPNVTIISQTKLTHTETVYNFEVQDFHTYHIGEYGVWVHNADCCGVLQKGGNKINGNTSKKLNEAWGTNYTSRDIGRGLESLKKENGIPANHHGKIMSNGDYVGENGINYGNILDYMP